ncbi:expressed unknown protein [Seminavis robusta]|uniref:Fungal lipase-type domain-containing protein n=1 Tax=Seminavis robusta TaxID=568900 RepID=A0A9N8HWX7_9STRA|nr:expressed unknown protein [Seminavis robusta]|eukprot:Sro2071_g313410.1 n/a (424) ;mRNA; f:14319-15693
MTEGTTTTETNNPIPVTEQYNLKTDHDDMPKSEQAGTGRQGRVYSTEYGQKPGGLQVEDMIFGLKMAHLSCTDDTEGRLASPGPNTLAAVEHIVGKEDAKKPLSELLKKHFNLNMDCWIDESGWRHARAVDTQGYIASNEDTIVLSYRFTTSNMDWMTNLSMTTSEWEPDRDELIGHAGWCSCVDGLYTKYFTERGKPRIHTGFYNNFVYTIPMIRKYVLEPLLKSDATPKKVYVVGCSLGAAIATCAFCFILQEMQPSLEKPDFCNHKLINVTAGSPRVCSKQMRDQVMERMAKLRPLDRAVICRMVYNHDVVPHMPPNAIGFVHLDKLVYIPIDGHDILINPHMKETKSMAEVKTIVGNFRAANNASHPVPDSEDHHPDDDIKTRFEEECEKTPEPIKDHMPYWYLTCLERLKQRADAGDV